MDHKKGKFIHVTSLFDALTRATKVRAHFAINIAYCLRCSILADFSSRRRLSLSVVDLDRALAKHENHYQATASVG
jgi:hypothetical protein